MRKPETDLFQRVYLTKREAAIYLNLSERQIDKVVRPFVKTYRPQPGWGTKILFHREDLGTAQK
jgi:isocitrate dehydrogenase kinase/phosphatase